MIRSVVTPLASCCKRMESFLRVAYLDALSLHGLIPHNVASGQETDRS